MLKNTRNNMKNYFANWEKKAILSVLDVCANNSHARIQLGSNLRHNAQRIQCEEFTVNKVKSSLQ